MIFFSLLVFFFGIQIDFKWPVEWRTSIFTVCANCYCLDLIVGRFCYVYFMISLCFFFSLFYFAIYAQFLSILKRPVEINGLICFFIESHLVFF